MDIQKRYEQVVADNRLSSYEERRAKHQANLAEAAKRNDDPTYQPKIDKTAYLQPQIVEGFLINADALPAGETVDIHLTVNGADHVLRDFCPHYPYERIGRNIYERTKARPEDVSLAGGQVVRNGDGMPASALTELGLHLPVWQEGVVYDPGTVVIHRGSRYLKLNDGDNTMPDAVPGGWEAV